MSWLPDAASLLAVAVACATVLGAGEALHRLGGLAAETTRKVVHVGMGLIAATFPWVFSDAGPVVLLCAGFAVILAAADLAGTLTSVHGVRRGSGGTLYFPAAVAALYLAGARRPWVYLASVLVLTLSDTCAALVGLARGRSTYRLSGGPKSLEGSLAFFLTAWILVPVGIQAGGLGERTVLAGLVALATTALEACAPHGSDNLVVPCGAFLLLSAVNGAPLEEQRVAIGWVAGLGALAGLADASLSGLRRRRPPSWQQRSGERHPLSRVSVTGGARTREHV